MIDYSEAFPGRASRNRRYARGSLQFSQSGLDAFEVLSDAVKTHFVSHKEAFSVTHVVGLVLVT